MSLPPRAIRSGRTTLSRLPTITIHTAVLYSTLYAVRICDTFPKLPVGAATFWMNAKPYPRIAAQMLYGFLSPRWMRLAGHSRNCSQDDLKQSDLKRRLVGPENQLQPCLDAVL